MQPNSIQLTEEETKVVAPLWAALDAKKEGFMQGIEMAKVTILAQVLQQRQPQEGASANG